MKILKSLSVALALACLVFLFVPCTASAQDTGPDPWHSSNLTRPTPEWSFVQSGLPVFKATQDNMSTSAYLPARVQASGSPVRLGDKREMNAVIGKPWKLVHSYQS